MSPYTKARPEKREDTAETEHAKAPQKLGKKVEDAASPLVKLSNLAKTTTNAMKDVEGLNTHTSKVEEMLKKLKASGVLQTLKQNIKTQEKILGPATEIKNEEQAKEFVEKISDEHKKAIETKEGEEKGFFGTLTGWFGGAVNAVTDALDSVFEELIINPINTAAIFIIGGKNEQELKKTIETEWLNEEYLGSNLKRAMDKHPAYLVTGSREFFYTDQEAHGGAFAAGRYFPETNVIMVKEQMYTETQRAIVIAHEYLHYVSRIGRSKAISGGLNEGLTELHAQQLVREHGYSPLLGVGYAEETQVANCLQSLVGEETLKKAYFTGDFTEVKKIVDQKLGGGAFEEFMGLMRKNGTEALVFLEQKMDDKKIQIPSRIGL